VAVPVDQGAPSPVALFFRRLDVRFDLGLQSLGEHPPRPLPGDLVEVEQKLFAVAFNLMHPLHRCLLPTDAPTSVSSV